MNSMSILNPGLNIIMNQRVGATDTPIYPFTRTANVKDSQGKTLDEIIATLAPKDFGLYVPSIDGEQVSNLRFLRNDNTWATIQSASTEQAGVVQLSDATNLEDSTVAATAKAVNTVQKAVETLGTDVAHSFLNIVSNIKNRASNLCQNPLNKLTFHNTSSSIYVRQRLVQEANRWQLNQCSGQCNPLLLTTGDLPRLTR